MIAGYVVTTPAQDHVALDLAHMEMGALRFLVSEGGLHAELPYGGVLYELSDAELAWSITAAQWKKLERGPLRNSSRGARAAIAKGDIKQAIA